METEVYRHVHGLRVSRFFHEKNLQSALSYKPREGDLFIVGFLKCGTTWMQHIVFSILNDGVAPQNMMEFTVKAPFLESVGAEGADKMPRPGAIKSHLPYDKIPFSKDAKYIYLARNPYDCCVSFYYHTKSFPVYEFQNGTFDEFFDMFIEGRVDYGDYFEHLLSWYDHRQDPNVFFLTYEDLKRDTKTWILRLAQFIGDVYGTKLKSHPEILENILRATSFEAMKSFNEEMKTWTRDTDSWSPEEKPESLKWMKESMGNVWYKPATIDFIRKGIVGDWRNHMSQAQIQRMRETIARKVRGSDVMNIWKASELP